MLAAKLPYLINELAWMDAQFSLVTKFNASGIAFYEYDSDTVGMFYHREQMTKTIFRGCFPDKCSESEKHLDDVIATGDNKNEGIEGHHTRRRKEAVRSSSFWPNLWLNRGAACTASAALRTTSVTRAIAVVYIALDIAATSSSEGPSGAIAPLQESGRANERTSEQAQADLLPFHTM